MNYLSQLADTLSKSTGRNYEECLLELKTSGAKCEDLITQEDSRKYAQIARDYGVRDADIADTISCLTGRNYESVYSEIRTATTGTRLASRGWGRRAQGSLFLWLIGAVVIAVAIVIALLFTSQDAAPEFIYTLF